MAADYDVLELGHVALQTGGVISDAKLAYKTYGELNRARDNVVLLPTSYGAQHTDMEAMMAAGRALDRSKYFIVVPNLFGNGLSSSPSNTSPPWDRAAFPRMTLYDNVMSQRRLFTDHLRVERIKLIVGYSMGAQQALQWGCLFPDMIGSIAVICGSARTSPHNQVFLEGVKAALTADAAFSDGWYEAPPVKGLRAFGRVYAGWAFSQDFFREREYFKLGLASVEETMRFAEGYFARRDANDLLAMLSTWHHADISDNDIFRGDFDAALGSITSRTIVMPSETDLYFRVRDNELEVAQMPAAQLRPIPSIWGHLAGLGVNPADNVFIDAALQELLG